MIVLGVFPCLEFGLINALWIDVFGANALASINFNDSIVGILNIN